MRKIYATPGECGSGRNVTGALQIGDDWPGTFFRGDESGGIADRLRGIARSMEDADQDNMVPAFARYLRELADTFSQCIIKQGD